MSKKFNKLVQDLLAKQGYTITSDGKDSTAFRDAIADAQKRLGLKVTRTVTDATLKALRGSALPSGEVPVPRLRPKTEMGSAAKAEIAKIEAPSLAEALTSPEIQAQKKSETADQIAKMNADYQHDLTIEDNRKAIVAGVSAFKSGVLLPPATPDASLVHPIDVVGASKLQFTPEEWDSYRFDAAKKYGDMEIEGATLRTQRYAVEKAAEKKAAMTAQAKKAPPFDDSTFAPTSAPTNLINAMPRIAK